jgi:hypothetical protein
MSTYNRPPWPHAVYEKFDRVRKLLGFLKRGSRWQLLDMLLSYAETHPDLFRRRP